MRIGAHVKTSGGISSSIQRAIDSGCESIQIFAANPNAWVSSPITDESAKDFIQKRTVAGLMPVVIHTQYLLNLGSPDPSNYAKSTSALTDAMHRANLIGAEYVVTHIGSHKGEGFQSALLKITGAIESAISANPGNAMLLLENSSGSGDSIGSSIDEIAAILNNLPDLRNRLGICLDTAHLWGAGYDVSDSIGIEELISEVDRLIGLDRLAVLHLNDSKVSLNSKKDRHENIGDGAIGMEAFKIIVNHPALRHAAGIAETPYEDDEPRKDVELLKSFRR